MPRRRPRAAAAASPSSALGNSASRFQRRPSGSRTGRLSKRCTTSRLDAAAVQAPDARPGRSRPRGRPRRRRASRKVEDLLQALESRVRRSSPGSSKNGAMSACQRALTSRSRHRRLRALEVLRLEVADEQPVRRAGTASSSTSRSRPGRESISGHTSRWRARYSSSRSGRTRSRKQTRSTSDHVLQVEQRPRRARPRRPGGRRRARRGASGPARTRPRRTRPAGAPKRKRELVLPIRNVAPGIDSPSATISFRRPSTVCVQPTIVTGP